MRYTPWSTHGLDVGPCYHLLHEDVAPCKLAQVVTPLT
jgi:hypothetical protein